MQTDPLVLGIDGGGTKTVALLASLRDEGEALVSRGLGGPGNPRAAGFAAALGAIDGAINAAFAAAGISRGPVAAACIALAGAGRPEERTRIEAWAAECSLAQRVMVVHDAAPLLAAGTPAGWGVALIAGTGSLAFGTAPDGSNARAGGWGYLIGDEGSGYALTVAGLRGVIKAEDGRGPPTALRQPLFERLRVREAQELIDCVYGGRCDRAALAGCADLVVAAAVQGDAVAQRIVDEAVSELVQMISAVARQLRLDGRTFPLAFAGGLLCAQAALRQQIKERLVHREFDVYPVTTVREPAQGCVRLARQRALETPVGGATADNVPADRHLNES